MRFHIYPFSISVRSPRLRPSLLPRMPFRNTLPPRSPSPLPPTEYCRNIPLLHGHGNPIPHGWRKSDGTPLFQTIRSLTASPPRPRQTIPHSFRPEYSRPSLHRTIPHEAQISVPRQAPPRSLSQTPKG